MSSPRPQPRPAPARRFVEAIAFALACAATAGSAILVKTSSKGPALVAIDQIAIDHVAIDPVALNHSTLDLDSDSARLVKAAPVSLHQAETQAAPPNDATGIPVPPSFAASAGWFNGRPIRPARVLWFTVTAYTPGAESCWPSDDGLTATLHSVHTNAGCLVAADTRLLPFGSLVSIDGYDQGRVVPVLDRGGKIQGQRIDVLMDAVEAARAWGVRRIPVVIWEYADGLPPTDPRVAR